MDKSYNDYYRMRKRIVIDITCKLHPKYWGTVAQYEVSSYSHRPELLGRSQKAQVLGGYLIETAATSFAGSLHYSFNDIHFNLLQMPQKPL